MNNRQASGYLRSRETALRYLAMVSLMPVGRWITTAQIRDALIDRGFPKVTDRTIQRDLWKLSATFGLEQMEIYKTRNVWRRTRKLDQVMEREAA